jgi:hypothetical protein
MGHAKRIYEMQKAQLTDEIIKEYADKALQEIATAKANGEKSITITTVNSSKNLPLYEAIFDIIVKEYKTQTYYIFVNGYNTVTVWFENVLR